ncbi:ABC transporter ATP-binding protein [Tessaracoccus sp. ZS01]|nr:ABC transporter ATP-binding protein [Tessaracoccus sp. ZS01]
MVSEVPGRSDVPAILTGRNLVKRFGATTALHGVDIDIREGEFLSIMGPSGCGKSTLLYALSGMDVPTEGTVQLDGTELTRLSQKELAQVRLTRMGFVFQQIHLLKNLSLLDNVVLPAHLARLAPRAELLAQARALMARVGVAHLADHDISQASGGQLQRVGICRALINRPRVLFADEPTGALDSTAAGEVLEILGELNRDGSTIVMVTHDPGVAARTHRVVEMRDGGIL